MDAPLKIPEILTSNTKDPVLVAQFLKTYRPQSAAIPSNLPTACLLEGKKGRILHEVGYFADAEEVFIYFEHDAALRRDSVGNVVAFWKSREPWEDYDFCMFPRSLKWCVGFTHNDYCVLTEKKPNQAPEPTAPSGRGSS